MPFENPSRSGNGNALDGEANGYISDGQAAVLEQSCVRELVRLLDFLSSFPPKTHDVDELCVGSKELGKFVHVMPIPAIGERLDNLPYFSDCIRRELLLLR